MGKEDDPSALDARWVPLLAAVVGVLGGVGGAYIGGVVANNGQEQRSRSEQAAALQESRRVAYQDFLGIANKVVITAEAQTSTDALTRAYTNLNAALAPVLLATDSERVESAAITLTEAFRADITKTDEELLNGAKAAAREFVRLARAELAATPER